MAERNDSGNTPGYDPQSDQRSRDPAVAARLDTVFDVLRNARRRDLLRFLSGADDQVVTLEDAVAAVAEAERARTGTAPDETAIRTDLHHSQIARLDDASIVEYDPRQGDIRIRDCSSLAEWLAFARRYEEA